MSVALVTAFLAACRGSTGPEDSCGLPQPDEGLDPSALRIGKAIFACGYWAEGEQPADEQVIVDVFFGRRGPEDPPDRPLAEHLASLASHGGRLCHEFNFPAARVRIDTDRVPELYADWFVSVYEIVDLRRYDWVVTVGYRRPVAEADVAQYVALGGEVKYRLDFINALVGALPDRSIPVLRSMEDVEYVEAAGRLCLAGVGSSSSGVSR